MKRLLKAFLVIFIVNLVENGLLLLVFGIPITQRTIIIVAVFTLVLTFALKELGVVE